MSFLTRVLAAVTTAKMPLVFAATTLIIACSSSGHAGAAAKGWPSSAAELRSRWNSLSNAEVQLSAFNGDKATFDLGRITFMSNHMMTLETHDHSAAPELCVIGYMTAFGASHDEAKYEVRAVIDDMHAAEASGNGPLGYKKGHGHLIGMGVSPSGLLTCTYLDKSSD